VESHGLKDPIDARAAGPNAAGGAMTHHAAITVDLPPDIRRVTIH